MFYKDDNYPSYNPDKVELSIQPVTNNIDKEAIYEDFLEKLNLFQQSLRKSINYDQIHTIFESFTMFIYVFPKKIKEYFSTDLCLYIQSFIDQNVINAGEIRIVKDAMILIAYICFSDINYIQIFSDNKIIDKTISVYLLKTHGLFGPVTFLLSSLLRQNLPSATKYICDCMFPAANDYCYAKLDNEEENIRIATSFLYFLSKYPQNVEKEYIPRIFEVVQFQIKLNEERCLPNNIFVYTLWTYECLLQNYSSNIVVNDSLTINIDYFVDEKMITYLSHLLDEEFIEKNNGDQKKRNENYNFKNEYFLLDNNPQRPLLLIYKKLFIARFKLFPQLIESISFTRIFSLTNSKDITVVLESFDLLRTIIIHHTDLIDKLIAYGLFVCLKEGLESVFSIKSAAYQCVYQLLLSKIPDLIYKTLLNEVFLLSIEYCSTSSEKDREFFLKAFLFAIRCIEPNGWIKDVVDYLTKNDSFTTFDLIFEDEPDELVINVQNTLQIIEK